MTTPKVSEEVAQEEINRWLDYRRISARKREESDGLIKGLVDNVMDGVLVINEDNSITHNLLFPIESEAGKASVTSINYKPRLYEFEISKATKGLKSGDFDGRMKAYAQALTGESTGILGKMESADHSISVSVISFF